MQVTATDASKDTIITDCVPKTNKKNKRQTRSEKICFHCNSVGHLAKYCPQKRIEESGSDGGIDFIYVPPKKIRFKSEADIQAFKDRIVAFKYQSRKNVCII